MVSNAYLICVSSIPTQVDQLQLTERPLKIIFLVGGLVNLEGSNPAVASWNPMLAVYPIFKVAIELRMLGKRVRLPKLAFQHVSFKCFRPKEQRGFRFVIGVPRFIIHLNTIFHSKPSIGGYPHDYGNPQMILCDTHSVC